MTEQTNHNSPVDQDTQTAAEKTSPPEKTQHQRGGHRMLYAVLGVFLLVQCAFVGYAHWFVTQGLPNALDNVTGSDLMRDVRALTESSLRGLGTPGSMPHHDPLLPPDPLSPADPQAKNNGSNIAPNAPFIQPQEDVSVDALLDIVESLTRDLDEQLRALEDPSYTPRSPGTSGDSLLPPGEGIALKGDPPRVDLYL